MMSNSINMLSDDLSEDSSNILTLANLYRLKSVLTNMLTRIDETRGTSDARVVTVSNTSLYALAAKYYGTVEQWTFIADANGLVDPQVEGFVTYHTRVGWR